MTTTPTTAHWVFFRRSRMAAGLSKTDLARAVGVNPRLVDYWERGQRQPQMAHVRALATSLRLTPAELLSEILSQWAPEI